MAPIEQVVPLVSYGDMAGLFELKHPWQMLENIQ